MGAIVGRCLRAKYFMDRLTKVRAFRKECRRPMEVQWNFLNSLLQKHQDTEFGENYQFSTIKNIRDFQKRIPIHSWDDIAPYIEEVKNGNQRALFPPSERILMFAETSGTTGQPKFIPVTESAYKFYGNSWDFTWSNVVREIPKAFYGKALYFPGDPEEGYVGEIPYGAITARAYAQQNRLVTSIYPYPYQVCKIKDYQLRYYTIMRIAVEKDITAIPIANPSTILSLFRMAQERRADIIEDIRRGRLRDVERLPEEISKHLLKRLRPNPKRARELEEIYSQTGDFLPQDYWPKCGGIMCFASGPLKLYLKELNEFFNRKKVAIYDFGLLASEGRFSFPISSIENHEGCCLTIGSNFFEFIPEDQANSPNPEALTLDQCEAGKRYFIVVTNAAGLYRYNISDLIKITGFYEKVPLIGFCNKGKHFSSITGEKLTEFQVTESVRRTSEKVGYILDDFIVCLHWDKRMPSYSLLKGENEGDTHEILQKIATSTEEELMQLNGEYRSKRQSHRLGPITLKIMEGHSYEDYEDQRQQVAHNLSQYKHVFLVSDPSFEGQFQFSEEIVSAATP